MQPHSAGSTGPVADRRVRLSALVLVAVHLSVVSWLALRPLSVVWVAPGNLEPFATIAVDLRHGPGEALRSVGGGMLRLAPLGILLPLLSRDLGGNRLGSFGRTVLTGAMVALALEYCQSMVPSRVADIDSVILDIAGIALAHQLSYRTLRRLTSRRRRRPRPAVPLVRHDAPPPRPTGAREARRTAASRQRPADHDTLVLSRLHV
ncbi:VanZ family protein [Streptomyces avicenniae]|uniref:VanZ family protein n=1 Tax=Streptomyces avicenniae TaxID=500153 RepID=UPI00167D980E|nr:VanZ family protein [Streptomyces avicenniae]